MQEDGGDGVGAEVREEVEGRDDELTFADRQANDQCGGVMEPAEEDTG